MAREDLHTVVRAFDEAVARVPDAPFVDFMGEAFTYGELDREVNRIAPRSAGSRRR